jgi:choline dehydrogenase
MLVGSIWTIGKNLGTRVGISTFFCPTTTSRRRITNAPGSITAKELGADIIDPSLHGNAGPIQTSFPEGSGVLDHAWGATFANLGNGVQRDPRHGATLGGYSVLKEMDKNATRSYAASAYYVPIAKKRNLTVLTNAQVSKICFASTGLPVRAIGVSYSVAGEAFFIRTHGEVILSAGSVQSPQILELSGIGSRDILEKYGIDVVVANSRVGENLQVSLFMPKAVVSTNQCSRTIYLFPSRTKSSTAFQLRK